MSDAVTVALIAMPAPTLLAAVSLWKQYVTDRDRREAQARIEAAAAAIKTQVVEVKGNVDGRFTEMLAALLTLTKEMGFKDGHAAGEREEKGRHEP